MTRKNGGATDKHVAIVGMTGVGKSTLVNVLTGSNCATVTNNAIPCTNKHDRYDIGAEGVRYTLWDTRGLNEASENGSTGPLARLLKLFRADRDADQELRRFLRGKNPRINLVLFCIEAEKVQVDAQWKNFNKIYVKFCRRKIRVGVVVTRVDSNTRNTGWKVTCEGMAREAVGESLDARLIEAVPAFERVEETGDCRSRLLRLITNFS